MQQQINLKTADIHDLIEVSDATQKQVHQLQQNLQAIHGEISERIRIRKENQNQTPEEKS